MSKFLQRAFLLAIASLSLANLLALQLWMVLFRTGNAIQPTGAKLVGAVLAVLMIACALWLVVLIIELFWHRNSNVQWKAIGLAIVWVIIFWGVLKPSMLQFLQHVMGVAKPFFLSVSLAGFVLILVSVWRYPAKSTRGMTLGALILAPFVGVTFFNALYPASQRGLYEDTLSAVPVSVLPAGASHKRTVVLLFDEFDYELAFESATKPKELPVLNELIKHSLFATHAYPPMHSTMMSVPAMLTGKMVQNAEARDQHPGDLILQHENGERVAFSEQDTLFSGLRRAGYRSLRMNDALLPSKRLPGIADADVVLPVPATPVTSIIDCAKEHLADLTTLIPFAKSVALDSKVAQLFGLPHPFQHVSNVADRLVDLAAEGDADLLFLHILLPHLPVVFDPGTKQFGPIISSDYRDNLGAVDLTVGRVLKALEANGRLADTNILVISDHFFRQKRAVYGLGDHRVPFIARFGRDEAPAGMFDKPFNTILFRPMIMEIVQGQIQDSKSLADWISQHATFGESPLLEYRKGW